MWTARLLRGVIWLLFLSPMFATTQKYAISYIHVANIETVVRLPGVHCYTAVCDAGRSRAAKAHNSPVDEYHAIEIWN